MNTVAAVIVASAVFAMCSSEQQESKHKFVKFYNCIACKVGSSAFVQYTECLKYEPDKCKEISDQCKKQLIPTARNETEQWEQICQNPDIAGKIYDCFGAGQEKTEMNEDDKENMKKFMVCAKAIYEEHCPK